MGNNLGLKITKSLSLLNSFNLYFKLLYDHTKKEKEKIIKIDKDEDGYNSLLRVNYNDYWKYMKEQTDENEEDFKTLCRYLTDVVNEKLDELTISHLNIYKNLLQKYESMLKKIETLKKEIQKDGTNSMKEENYVLTIGLAKYESGTDLLIKDVEYIVKILKKLFK